MTVTTTRPARPDWDRPARPEWDGPAFPPVDDAVNAVKRIDWADVRQRARKGVNNCGIVLAVIGEKIHDLGAWLAQV